MAILALRHGRLHALCFWYHAQSLTYLSTAPSWVSVLIPHLVLCFFASLRHNCIIFIMSSSDLWSSALDCSKSECSESECSESECSKPECSKFERSESKCSELESSDVNITHAASIAEHCNGWDDHSESYVSSGLVDSVSSAVNVMIFAQNVSLEVLLLMHPYLYPHPYRHHRWGLRSSPDAQNRTLRVALLTA